MNDIVPFQFNGAAVRIVTIDGEPWFLLPDVCRVLEIGNPSDAARRVDDDEKAKYNLGGGLDTIEGANINDLARGTGNNEAWLVNEPGLYRLILTSRKPSAKAFQKWVVNEVLPAIRRTGGYGVDAARAADIAQEAAGIVLAHLGMVPAKIDTLGGKLDQLLIVTNELAMNRRVTIPVNVVRKHLTVLQEDGGNCPHCKKPLVFRGESITAILQRRGQAWEADHFFANMSANFEHTWVICVECHNQLTPWRPGPTMPRIGPPTRKFEGYHEGAKEVLRRLRRGEAEAEARVNAPLFAATGNILPLTPRPA